MNRNACVLVSAALLFLSASAHAITPKEAGFIDVKVDYGAAGNGTTNDWSAIQNALNAAETQGTAVFLPAGDYLVDKQLILKGQTGLVGSRQDPTKRSRIILEASSADFSGAGPLTAVITHDNPGSNAFYRLFQHFDIVIRPGNTRAAGVAMNGAENCNAIDIHVDLTEGGAVGFHGLFGSGGSCANLKVTGGGIGVNMVSGRPSAMLVGCVFRGQSTAAISQTHRGGHSFVGCEFELKPGAKLHYGISNSQGGLGGSVAYVDCKVMYESPSPLNTLLTMISGGNSAILSNTYVRYAAVVVGAEASPNPNGWVHFEELIYDNPTALSFSGKPVNQGIWQDGVKVFEKGLRMGTTTLADTYTGPADLLTRHRLPDYPSFETPGAIDVSDYSGQKSGDDWGPAFNAAIAQAEAAGHNIVWVPKGEFIVRSPITLREKTVLAGMHPLYSTLLGKARASAPFFGSTTDPWLPASLAPAMIESPNSKTATCMLADIAVRKHLPSDFQLNSNRPLGFSSIKWRSGRNSIIKNVNVHLETTGFVRDYAMLPVLENAVGLKHTAVGFTSGNLLFFSDSRLKYHSYPANPARILIESHGGNKRIVAKSVDSLNLATETYTMANVTIKGSGGATDWTLTSLKIGNAHFNPKGGNVVTLRGYDNGQPVHTHELDWRGQKVPREQLQALTLNWSPVDSVVVTSPVQFSLDDVVGNGATSDFSGVSGTGYGNLTGYSQTVYDVNDGGGNVRSMVEGYQSYNLPPDNQPKIVFCDNGGGRVYTYTTHGKQNHPWGTPYVAVVGTREPLNFYHLHAQHSSAGSPRFEFIDAANIDVFSVKIELQFSNLYYRNCDNVRVFGHGGLTAPIGIHSTYRFDDCSNYCMALFSQQLYDTEGFQRTDYWNELPVRDYRLGNSHNLVTVQSGVKIRPDNYHRPSMWKFGNPTGAFGGSSSPIKGSGLGGIVTPAFPVALRGLRLTNPTESKLTVQVMDLAGRTVYSRTGQDRSLLLPVSAAKMYLFRVSVAGRTRVFRTVACESIDPGR